jgi:pimeloyl-ACP methyl ester carboxylesterase
MVGAIAVTVLGLGTMPLRAQHELVGQWDGVIAILGNDLGITVVFEATGAQITAQIDIPQQGAQGLPLANLRFDDPNVHFELPAAQGTAVFDGRVQGDSVTGDFTQAGYTGTFSLHRAEPAAAEPAAQEAQPYVEEEVSFRNDAILLAGTLTLPDADGPHPAVVMITGSGAQNRDEELFGFKPFRIIADHLTRHGIAVLRYDDRGVGGSTGSVSQATSEELAGDVLAAVGLLEARSDIDPRRIGLIGHSEGGIIAPIVAAQSSDIAFIVLMAGTAVTGERILLAQGEAILRANGATEARLQAQREMQQQIFAVVRSGAGMEQLAANLREQIQASLDSLPVEQRAAITDEDAFVNSRLEGQLSMIRSPWFRFFLDYDPAVTLEQVTVPVLALFGELDLQVPLVVNREPLTRALERGGNDAVTIRVFPRANHLFLTAETGSPNEYPTMEKEFVPGFLEEMTDWILARVAKGDS